MVDTNKWKKIIVNFLRVINSGYISQFPEKKHNGRKKVELSFFKTLSNAICKTSLVPAYILPGSFVWSVATLYLEQCFPYNHSFSFTCIHCPGEAIPGIKTTGKEDVKNPILFYNFPSYKNCQCHVPSVQNNEDPNFEHSSPAWRFVIILLCPQVPLRARSSSKGLCTRLLTKVAQEQPTPWPCFFDSCVCHVFYGETVTHFSLKRSPVGLP